MRRLAGSLRSVGRRGRNLRNHRLAPDGEHGLLGLTVVAGGRAGVGVRRIADPRVGDEARARRCGGVDRRPVLAHARADHRGADEQQALDILEGCPQRGGIVEVAAAHVRTARGQIGDRVGVAGHEDDVGRRGLLQEGLGGQATELARGSGDGDGHDSKTYQR